MTTNLASASAKAWSLCICAAASLFACTGSGENAATDERQLGLEAEVRSLEVSPEALTQESAQLEKTTSKTDSALRDREQWSKGKDKGQLESESAILERTARLAEDFGGEVYFVDHAERGQRSVLVVPREVVEGETPLIVSLHGFGGDSAYQTSYVPLHERVDTDGFALLLPNGALDSAGSASGTPPTNAAMAESPAETTWPISLSWCQRRGRSRTSGRCTSSVTLTAGSCRTTWPARACRVCAPWQVLPAPATSRTQAARAHRPCPCCISTPGLGRW